MNSERIPGLTLENTRDLGGLPAADGKHIRPGRLIRSGALSFASDEDVRILSEKIRLRHIIDLRTDVEHENHPNPVFEGSREHFLPALTSAAMGITRGQKSPIEQLFNNAAEFDAVAYMEKTYTGIVSSDQGQKAYRTLFEIMLSCEEGAVLWHCTVGKDRTGIGAMCVMHALGVPNEIIEQDYLATNEYNQRINKRDREHILGDVPEELHQVVGEKLDSLFTAKLEYLDTARRIMEDLHGTVDGYLENALGLTPERKQRLREMYLE